MAYASDSLRLLCTTEAMLVRTWGELWLSVAVCLSVLAFADTLADFATLASVTVRPARESIEDGVEFVVDHPEFQLRLRAVDAGGRKLDLPDFGQDALRLVRNVAILSLSRPTTAARA